MKRRIQRLLALSLVVALSLSLTACQGKVEEPADAAQDQSGEEQQQQQEETPEEPQEKEDEETPKDEGETDTSVTSMQIGENQVLVYHPTPNAMEDSAVKMTCTAPVFLVFGDTAYDESSAMAYAQDSGLADIAAQEGGSVCFVNPAGDGWADADAVAYGLVAQAISDSSTDVSTNGITTSINFMTQEESQGITGTQGRIYVYGIGAGADYVAANVLKVVEAETFWGGTVNVTPAGVTVSGLTNADAVEENDIPVVSIGGSEDVNGVLEEKCGSFLAEDTEDYGKEYADLIGNNRRQAGVLLPIYDWAAEGIVENVETATVTTSPDNQTFAGEAEHPVNYVTYYAEDLDVENGNVPLVLCFHGGGNTALFEAQATEWPLIGKEHGFITVSVDLHFPNCTAAEMVELIDKLKEEYSIDSSRIYASGFSMGGCKSWDLYEQFPQVIAGLAPMDATAEPGVDSFDQQVAEPNSDVAVPVFYVGGETSPLPELPFQEEKVVNRVKNLFAVNQVVTQYTSEFAEAANWSNPIWGIDGDMTYQVTDQKAFTDSTLTVMLFASQDGKYYTALTSASNQSHEVYARNSWAAWDFLSQFSRAEDGSIVIEAVTYSLASDDGSVTDNSYNMQ